MDTANRHIKWAQKSNIITLFEKHWVCFIWLISKEIKSEDYIMHRSFRRIWEEGINDLSRIYENVRPLWCKNLFRGFRYCCRSVHTGQKSLYHKFLKVIVSIVLTWNILKTWYSFSEYCLMKAAKNLLNTPARSILFKWVIKHELKIPSSRWRWILSREPYWFLKQRIIHRRWAIMRKYCW